MNTRALPFLMTCFSLMAATLAGCKPVSAAPFSFGGERVLLLWNNEPFVTREGINYLGDSSLADKAERSKRTVGDATVENLWRRSEEFSFRRELAVSPNEAEGTVQMYLPCYRNDLARTSVTYEFEVPLDMLAGGYTAIIGRTHSPKTVTGKLSAATPNGALPDIPDGTRWITFHTGRSDLTFDFNPKGVTSYTDFGPGDMIGRWKVSKHGNKVRFSFSGEAPAYGGDYGANWRVFEGGMEQYEKRHFHQRYAYFSSIPLLSRYLFGGGKPHEKTDHVILPAKAETVPGWKDGASVESVSLPAGGLYGFAAVSSAPNAFRFSIEQPGVYILTLQSLAGEAKARPMQAAIAGRELIPADASPLSAGTLQTITFAEYLDAGVAEIRFSGDWAVSAITLQPLLHACEDFLIRRGIWLDESVLELTPVFRNRNHDPLRWAVDFRREAPVPSPKGPVVLPPRDPWKANHPDPSGLEWRYTAMIGGMGPSNWGTFTEFSTREEIARRLDELQEQGVGFIQTNGFLARHLWGDQKERVWEMLKIITEEAHKRGIKVADHQDVTLLWNRGQGFRYLIENIGMLQRSRDGNVPNWGINILNPEFKKRFFREMTDLVAATDIDGLMLDEVVFHGDEFCFSPATREQFTRDTGLVMPLSASSPVYGNLDSALWKAWLAWRSEAIADWFAELRQHIETVKPGFVLMRYTTDGGTSSPAVFRSRGGTLENSARAIDMVGTEIMSRNVHETYRPTFSYRKLRGAFRSLDDFPLFGLVYTRNPEVFEFGWALLNMNRQTAWQLGGAVFSKSQTPYLGWKSNMDLINARPVADIGILYSIATRNWASASRQNSEAGGISQTLTENHIPHEILYAESLISRGVPSSLRLLILPDATALGREEGEQILRFVESGGRLLITGKSGTLDEWGRSRETSLLAQLRQAANAGPDQDHFRLGSGEVFFSGDLIGVENFEETTTVGKVREFEENPAAAAHCLDAVLQARGDSPLPYRILSAPRAILTSAFTQPLPDGKQALVFHFLNASGAVVKKGGVIKDSPSGPVFPPVTGDAVIETQWPHGPARAYAVKPGSEEKFPLEIEKIADDRLSIKVPAQWLSRYSLVFVEEE